MISIDHLSVMNFDNATRGMRNPLSSWDKQDSHIEPDGTFVFGEKDLDLAKRLCKAGTDHRKFIRQIFVSVDITAPMYWWKEFDTYKVGTVANSTSTMHKIHAKRFSRDDFSCDHMLPTTLQCLDTVIAELEQLREAYLETKDKDVWYSMIQLLPSSYNQTRTVTMNYENLANMYFARRDHKLAEWRTFTAWERENLPYFKDLILQDDK
ncbi:MAG: hypothetical protein ACOX1O_05835 [Eggerthellaceae bacterium]|jgi:hypothetical protein